VRRARATAVEQLDGRADAKGVRRRGGCEHDGRRERVDGREMNQLVVILFVLMRPIACVRMCVCGGVRMRERIGRVALVVVLVLLPLVLKALLSNARAFVVTVTG
jgi:hypothetical protein